MQTEWGFPFPSLGEDLFHRNVFSLSLLPERKAMWLQMPAAWGPQLRHELKCTSGMSIFSLYFFAIPEETEKPLCLTQPRQRLTSIVCAIKEAYPYPSLLWHKCNQILKRVRLRRRNRSLWAAGTVTVEKTLSLCSHMYKILSDKPYKNKLHTNHWRGKALLLDLKKTALLMGKHRAVGFLCHSGDSLLS